jgi:hypothetical protein
LCTVEGMSWTPWTESVSLSSRLYSLMLYSGLPATCSYIVPAVGPKVHNPQLPDLLAAICYSVPPCFTLARLGLQGCNEIVCTLASSYKLAAACYQMLTLRDQSTNTPHQSISQDVVQFPVVVLQLQLVSLHLITACRCGVDWILLNRSTD